MNKKLTPTTIYVFWPGSTEEDAIREINQLGQFTYPKKHLQDNSITHRHVFTKYAGWTIMEELIRKDRTDILEATKIISSTGREYTFEKFLNSLENVEMQ